MSAVPPSRGLFGWLGPSPATAPKLDVASFEVSPAGALVDSASHREGPLLIGWSGKLDLPAFVAAYRARGRDALRDAVGPAAVAVLDAERSELLLAVDRFGIEPLYLFETETGVVFASSLAALRRHPSAPEDVDAQAVFDYVYFHMVPSPRSILRGVHRLEPGECLVARHGAVERSRYWRPEYEPRGAASEDELIEEYKTAVRAAVGRSLGRARGEVGAFLSGGTDSSTLTGLLGELTGAPPRTYSIGFDVPGYDESRYARIAVEHFGARHHELVVTPGHLLETIPKLAEAYDEPFGNASAVAAYHCASLAREDGVDTMLAGDGGDEIFAGNARYAKQQVFERYFKLPGFVRARLLEPFLGSLREGTKGVLGKAKSYVQQAQVPLPDRLETYNFLSRIAPGRVFSDGFLDSVETAEPLALLRRSYAEAPTGSVLNRLLYLDIKFTLADNDLRKVEGTSQLAGVDVEYPFLDPGLVDFANALPPDLKLKGGKLRYFFKKASEGFLPDAILTKSKHGFGVPCGRWMRDEPQLRELAYDSLKSLGRRGYLRTSFVDELIDLHQGEHVDYYGVMVWVLTMLEQWHQHHLD